MTNSVGGMWNFNVKHIDNQDLKCLFFFVSIIMATQSLHLQIHELYVRVNLKIHGKLELY